MNSILWQQNEAKIIKHFEGCYTLEYKGKTVMEATNFDVVSRYVWAEFI